MKRKKALPAVYLLLSISLIFQPARTEEEDGAGRIHSPAEIYKIMEESNLVYTFTYYGGQEEEKELTSILPGRFRVSEDSAAVNKVLLEYDYSPVVEEFILKGDSLRSMNKYADAVACYINAWDQGGRYYHPALIKTGNCYFAQGLYDSAAVYFRRAIEGNFMSYQAHWFLSDCYFYLDRVEDAYRELLTAHLLNINHDMLFNQLKKLRTRMERPWKDWGINPRYEIKEKEGKIVISAPPEWLAYAMVKAVWRYEPGYSDSMSGSTEGTPTASTLEEREAMAAHLAVNPDDRLDRIIRDGYADEMLIYEIIAREYPILLALIDDDTFSKIIEYVDRYH